MYLVEYLMKEKAQVFITDIFEEKLSEVARVTGAQAISPAQVYDFPMDIYAPCALGATLNDYSIPSLTCDIVAGAANNQLADEETHGNMLLEKGILYAPDFLINAGGLMNVYAEYLGGYSKELALKQTETIYDTNLRVLNLAADKGLPPQQVAMDMAWQRISSLSAVKLAY
jgi:leucine dehydrogenase